MNALDIVGAAGRVMLQAAVLLGMAGATGTADAQWSPETPLSAGSGDVWGKGIAASDGVVHLIWGDGPIQYRRSMDDGETWSDDDVLTPSGRPVLTDPLVAQGADVYVVYLRDIRSARDWCCRRPIGDVYFRRSVDGGLTWEPEIQLTAARGALRVSLATSGSRLDLVWMDFRTGNWDLYYRRSLDGGRTWEPEIRLVTGGAGGGAERPQIASSGDWVHVVWMDDRDQNPPCYTTPACPEVYYKRSSDGGSTWDHDRRLTFDPPFSGRPDVAVLAPATVVVGYDEDRADNRGHEQYVTRSLDNGSTWSSPLRLSFAPEDSQHTALVAAGSAAHLAWFDGRAGDNIDIYYRASLDGGASWEPEERVTLAGEGSTTPLLAATPNYVHVIWLDRRTGSQKVWYRRRKLAETGGTAGP